MEKQSQICSYCKKEKPINDFAYDIKKHTYKKTCLLCSIKNKKSRTYKNKYEIKKLSRSNDPR